MRTVGAEPVFVRTADDLAGIEALVLPGGESTTIGRLARRYGLIEPLRAAIEGGMPTLGTCAGMIFLASGTTGEEQPLLEVLDIVVERNAFGRQVESFEEWVEVDGLDEPVEAVYIRAPWIEKVGGSVDVLARSHDHPVMVRQGSILATSFHPELTGDVRIHTMLLDLIDAADAGEGA